MSGTTFVYDECLGTATWEYVTDNKAASANFKVCSIALNDIDPLKLSFSHEFFSQSLTKEETDKFLAFLTAVLNIVYAKNITSIVKQESPVAQSIFVNYEINNVEQNTVDSLTSIIASVCETSINDIAVKYTCGSLKANASSLKANASSLKANPVINLSKIDDIINSINGIYFEEQDYLGLVLPDLKYTFSNNNKINNDLINAINTISPTNRPGHEVEDTFNRCKILREAYKKNLFDSGYKTSNLNSTFDNFPIGISNNSDLLGQLISQLTYTQFLEKSIDKKFLLIKLDQKSKNKELNILSSILRENIPFQNLILVFDYQHDKKNNFLSLNHIIYNNNKIYKNDNLWLKLLQSAYTELFLLIEIDHTMWHLRVAHIIYLSTKCLKNTKIIKIFEMASKNVYGKASDVKNILYGTPFVFQQILNDNKKFIKYAKINNETFFNNFNIDTIFNEYIINGLNPNQHWITGMKSNINIINNFVNKVVNKSNLSVDNLKLINTVDYYNDKYSLNYKNVSIKKYLEILFVTGTAFHSTAFEFTKEIFTDIIFINKYATLFYQIAIGTISTDISISFGDVSLYKGEFYKKEVDYLFQILEKNRQIIEKKLKNSIFKNYNFSTKKDISLTYQPNTYTTYV